MKKTVKFLCLSLSVAIMFLAIGCKKQEPKLVSLATIVYGEVLPNGGSDEWKMVLVPTASQDGSSNLGLGGAVLPDEHATDPSGESVIVEKGDLIIMTFEEGIYIRQETDPKVFIDDPVSIKVVSKNYSFTETTGGYTFVIPLLDIYNGQLVKEKRTIEFYTYKSSEKPTEKAVYSTVIDNVSEIVYDRTEGYVTFFVAKNSMSDVINSLAFGYVWVVL